MTQLQNQRNVTLSHVCVSMQSVQYCNSHLSHMDIFSGSNLVQQSVDSKIVPVSSIAPEGWGPKEGGNATSPLHSRGSPKEGEQNQKSKPTPRVTMMHHATKRGFKDCPGFLNSTGRLGPKRGRKCYVTLAFSGVPNKGGQNQKSKPTLGVTMMPLRAPSITKYGSLVRPDAQIVALRAHCA